MTRIRELRTARGLTQAQLAERIGINQSNIAQMERAGYQPRLETLQKFADALDCEIGDLIGATR